MAKDAGWGRGKQLSKRGEGKDGGSGYDLRHHVRQIGLSMVLTVTSRAARPPVLLLLSVVVSAGFVFVLFFRMWQSAVHIAATVFALDNWTTWHFFFTALREYYL